MLKKFKHKDPKLWGKRADPLEKDIEKHNVDYADSLGVLSRKYKAPGRTSVPDRMYIFDGGIIVFIEYKRLGKGPTPKQTKEINKMLAKGAYVYVIDNREAGKFLINMWYRYSKALAGRTHPPET